MSKKIILCIDDDAAGLTLRGIMLQSEGYEVFTASSGAEALAVLHSQPIDAIVLDYQMPAMNGADVARLVRENRRNIPIILLSGYMDDVPPAALHLVNALVTKGGSPAQLLQVLKNLLDGLSSERITVLNVNDDDQQRSAISGVLKQAGFNVMEAKTGRETLELASSRPSLIILDITLPDMLGFDVCRHLKSNAITRNIPVIHISATYAGHSVSTESVESGAARVLEIPADLAKVVEVVQQELDKQQIVLKNTA
jgi:CheY-like chemotaxis protein